MPVILEVASSFCLWFLPTVFCTELSLSVFFLIFFSISITGLYKFPVLLTGKKSKVGIAAMSFIRLLISAGLPPEANTLISFTVMMFFRTAGEALAITEQQSYFLTPKNVSKL